MEEFKKLIWFIIHTFTGCEYGKNLRYYDRGRDVCKKCGRKYFRFHTY